MRASGEFGRAAVLIGDEDTDDGIAGAFPFRKDCAESAHSRLGLAREAPGDIGSRQGKRAVARGVIVQKDLYRTGQATRDEGPARHFNLTRSAGDWCRPAIEETETDGAVGFVLRIPSCKRPGAPIAQHGNQPQGNRKRGGHVDIPLKTRLDRLFPGKTVDQIHSLQAALAGSHSLITGINTQGLGSMAPDGITFLLFQENPAAEGIDPPTLQSISVGRGFHRSDWNRQPRFPESFRSDNPTGHGMMIGIDAGESALN